MPAAFEEPQGGQDIGGLVVERAVERGQPAALSLSRAVDRYARAWTDAARMRSQALPVLEYQKVALREAGAALEAARPGATGDLLNALQYEPAPYEAMTQLQGRARVAQLVAGIEYEARVLWRMGGSCLGVALVLGLVLSPYLVSVLFWGSWQTGVAAIVMNADRNNAGAALMQAGNPDGWNKLVNNWNLVQANQKEIDACREEATKTKKAQRCTITVSAK